MHLETEFKGQDDGYRQWTAAREIIGIGAEERLGSERLIAEQPIGGCKLKKYKLQLRSDTREVVVNGKPYKKVRPQSYRALSYALGRRKEAKPDKYFDRRKLCQSLEIVECSMSDIFKGTLFYGTLREHRLVMTAKDHCGTPDANKFYLDVDVGSSEETIK
jgi:hypothetical protein